MLPFRLRGGGRVTRSAESKKNRASVLRALRDKDCTVLRISALSKFPLKSVATKSVSIGLCVAALAGCAHRGDVASSGDGIIQVREACPIVAVPAYTGDVTLFDPTTARTVDAVDVTANISGLRSTCDTVGDQMVSRAMFLVVDSKVGISGDWVNTVQGPDGVEVLKAAIDTTMDASVGASYSAFDRTMKDWQASMIKWRCGLSGAERARYGVKPGWDCKNVQFFIGRLGFDQLDPARAAVLEAVPTRFQLPQGQVDDVIAAGRDTLRASPIFQAFARGL